MDLRLDRKPILPPAVVGKKLPVAALDQRTIRRKRQKFDLAGHRSHPDVTRLVVNRTCQSLAALNDEAANEPI